MAITGAQHVTDFSASLGKTFACPRDAVVQRSRCPISTAGKPKVGQRLRARVQSWNAVRPVPHPPGVWRTADEFRRHQLPAPKASAQDTQIRPERSAEISEGIGIKPQESSGKGNARDIQTVHIGLTPLTPENFAPFGQVCGPSVDGAEFGEEDAQLELEGGVPRLYLLRLKGKALKFDRITHHARVTQCLGSADGRPWYMGVAPASLLSDVPGENARPPWAPPAVKDVRVFRVEGPTFLKLNKGTWHAGPLFEDAQMDFYNLEHTDTNVTDHNTHVFSRADGIQFTIDAAS